MHVRTRLTIAAGLLAAACIERSTAPVGSPATAAPSVHAALAMPGSTYLVNSESDFHDPDAGTSDDDHQCDDAPGSSVGRRCSLRAAADNVNAAARGTPATVGFDPDVAVARMEIRETLTFENPVTISGGGRTVNGDSVKGDLHGIRLRGPGSVLQSLNVRGFRLTQIVVDGPATGSAVRDCRVGGSGPARGQIGIGIGGNGTVVENCTIGGIEGAGIHLAADDAVIRQNHIGADATGNSPLAIGSGILADEVAGTIRIYRRNRISENVVLAPVSLGIVAGSTIEKNRLGLGSNGVPRATSTLSLAVAGDDNVVRDNIVYIAPTGGLQTAGARNQVLQNTLLGNATVGVATPYPALSVTGGGNLVAQNQVGGSTGDGIMLAGDGGANTIRDNDVAGGLGIGIEVGENAPGTTLVRNAIRLNHGAGIHVYDLTEEGTSGIRITDNTITDNQGPGIDVENRGGHAILNNVIRGNRGAGVVTRTGAGLRTTIRMNAIVDNRASPGDLPGLGIDQDADGVTPNVDGGVWGDRLPNFPVLSASAAGDASSKAAGTLRGAPNTAYTVDFYSNAACDASGYGEGEAHIGSTVVTTDAAGKGTFLATVGASAAGRRVSATATDPGGTTSEFSQCVESFAEARITPPVVQTVVYLEGGSFLYGTLRDRPATRFTVALAGRRACEAPADDGIPLGAPASILTDAAGNASFQIPYSGWTGTVVATATDADGHASAPSNCATAQSGGTEGMDLKPDVVSIAGTSVVTAVLYSRPLAFDATRIHPALVRLLVFTPPNGTAYVRVLQRGGAYNTFVRDVDGDGTLDMGYNFSMADLRAAGIRTTSVLSLAVVFEWRPGELTVPLSATDPSQPSIRP